MNKRIIMPRKPLVLAFAALLLEAAAVTVAVVLTAQGPSLPFEAGPQPGLILATTTPTPKPSPVVTRPPVATPTAQPTPTPPPVVATDDPTPITRRPAALDPPQAPTPVPTPTPIPGEYRPDLTEQLYALLNNQRTSAGIAGVGRNSSLTGSAEYYARLVFLRDPYDLNHWLDGGPGDRAWARGFCCGVGEIIVESEGSAQGMVDLWMTSAPHESVILDPQYVVNGIACYGGAATGDDGNVHHPIVCVGDFGSG
jgi:uncharacterized protein YkwD